MLDKQCSCGHARSAHHRGHMACRSVNVLDDCFDEECSCELFVDKSAAPCAHDSKLEALALFLEWMNAK